MSTGMTQPTVGGVGDQREAMVGEGARGKRDRGPS